MDKLQIVGFLQKVTDAIGPSVTTEEIDFGNGNVGTFLFRRLPYIEMDRLRLHAINTEGKFDKTLHVGANARLVAASLCDDTGAPVYTEAEVSAMPTAVVDKLNEAAQRANALTAAAKEEVAKK